MQPWDEQMQTRARAFAGAILDIVDRLPNTRSAGIIANQIGRSATSVMANHAESARPRSVADQIAKQGICLQDLQETRAWLMLLFERDLIDDREVGRLLDECDTMIGLFVASVRKLEAKS